MSREDKYLRILKLLRDNGEMTGMQLVKADSKLSMWSIYNRLYELQLVGEVTSRLGEHKPLPRRWYSITTKGRKRLIEADKGTADLLGVPA